VIDVYAPGISSCFGDLDSTLSALHEGRRGTRSLADIAGFDVPGVAVVYADPDIEETYELRAAAHLRRALGQTLASLRSPKQHRTAAVVCTGLGSTPGDEARASNVSWVSAEQVVRDELGPDVDTFSITNACSASGTGLAIGADLLAGGRYDQVLVAAADSMTRAMLTMIGKVAAEPAAYCAPFDARQTGAVLGEGAATCVLVPTDVPDGPKRFGSVRAIECSSDAGHPTAPDARVITRTVLQAISHAGVTANDVDFVIPHGTGTTLNDECETSVYSQIPDLVRQACFLPLKGGIGHTSGASFLMSVLTAMAICRGMPSPVYVPEQSADAPRLRWQPTPEWDPNLALVCAYGFGGANAVGVIAA
jgi:3-oxoacyl-[acyl-carrier-protein] synthase II